MSKKKGLGRGLSALIPGDAGETAVEGSALRSIPVGSVRPNPHQPRTTFDPDELAELAASIKAHGLIQPLIVTEEEPGRFTLIAGERRLRASQLAGLAEVTVVVKEATPQNMLVLALIENIQRSDLNPVEEALAFQQLVDEYSLTQEQVAERVGKSRTTVTNIMRLLRLPARVQQALTDGLISGRHGRELLRLENEDQQLGVLGSIISKDLNVRQTAALIDKMLNQKKPAPRPTKRKAPELVALQDSFRQALGTRVDVNRSGQGGKIVIHYYSDEELNAIFEQITGRLD